MIHRFETELDLPDDVPEEALRAAETRAREAALIHLQQVGEITIRQAARELSLGYSAYLDRLNQLGLPADNAEPDFELAHELAEAYRARQAVPA